MTRSRLLVITLAVTSLMAFINTGCSSSSTGSNSSGAVTTTTTSSYTNCTENQSTQSCIPTLGNYGDTVEYFGQVAVTDAAIMKTLIAGIPSAPIPSTSLVDSSTFVDIYLQAGATGLIIQMTIYMGSSIPNPPNPYVSQWQYILTGSTQFTAGTANPSGGTITMNVEGDSSSDPVAINSLTEPWDGSVEPNMEPLALTIGGTNLGNVGLIRIK